MSLIRVCIREAGSGQLLEAQVCVISSGGHFTYPQDALLKVGSGTPFFYSDGQFTVQVPKGYTEIRAERGIEYEPAHLSIVAPGEGEEKALLKLKRWINLPVMGWYPGNTHFHYRETEDRPYERLRMDPKVHDLSVAVISRLKRRELPYASNKYPVGVLEKFSTRERIVDCGEENRHNYRSGGKAGHVMFMGLKETVEPVSRGTLAGESAPDYPSLCYACDRAHEQGGVCF